MKQGNKIDVSSTPVDSDMIFILKHQGGDIPYKVAKYDIEFLSQSINIDIELTAINSKSFPDYFHLVIEGIPVDQKERKILEGKFSVSTNLGDLEEGQPNVRVYTTFHSAYNSATLDIKLISDKEIEITFDIVSDDVVNFGNRAKPNQMIGKIKFSKPPRKDVDLDESAYLEDFLVNTYDAPQATDKMINSCEQKLGLAFPENYKSFLKHANGGLPNKNTYDDPVEFEYGKQTPSRPLYFFGVEHKGADLLDVNITNKGKLSPGCLLIAKDDRGGMIILDTESSFVVFWKPGECAKNIQELIDDDFLIDGSFSDFADDLYKPVAT